MKETRPEDNSFLLYKDENGKTNVSVRFADEDVWVTQVQLAELYETTRQNVGQHIDNIYKDGELPKEATIKKFFIVQKEGSRDVRRELDHYNLDVIIAIGYRVQSPVATRFRKWATTRLHEFIQKGFTLDDERLKNIKGNYVTEDDVKIARNYLSEQKNPYQEVMDLPDDEIMDFAKGIEMARKAAIWKINNG